MSRYHAGITGRLRAGAVETFLRAGGREADLRILESPGAWELVTIVQGMLGDLEPARRFDAVVALGCVVTGETTHDRYINEAVASGLMRLGLEANVPVAFGLLTCQTIEQAEARAGGPKGNKGAEATAAAIEAAATRRQMREDRGAGLDHGDAGS